MKSVSGKDMCKALKKTGWSLARVNGSHHIYSKAGVEEIISVPVHGSQSMRIGLQTSLMKAAGLTEKDL